MRRMRTAGTETARRAMKRLALAGPALAGLLFAAPLPAQLRPLSPLDWSAFLSPRPVSAGIGAGVLVRQIASLAGTRGDLLDLGHLRVSYRSGRIGVEAEGTVHRRFRDEAVLRPPAAGANAPTGSVRTDAGDVILTTMIRLSPDSARAAAALRLSTRLATTSNEPGLERDRSDFFAMLAGRLRHGGLAVTAEAGVGVLGTRNSALDQVDVLAYSAGAEVRLRRITATGAVLGQDDLHSWVVRGNESLSEVRLGLRAGGDRWITATAILGLAEHSPGAGLYVMAGIRR